MGLDVRSGIVERDAVARCSQEVRRLPRLRLDHQAGLLSTYLLNGPPGCMPLCLSISICVKRQCGCRVLPRDHTARTDAVSRAFMPATALDRVVWDFVDPASARAGPEQGWQVPGSADAQRQLGLQGLSPSFPAPPDGNSSKLCPQIVVRQYARVTTTGLVSGVYSLCERKPCATLWWPFGVPWRYGRSPTLVWPVRILQRQPQFCVAGISL